MLHHFSWLKILSALFPTNNLFLRQHDDPIVIFCKIFLASCFLFQVFTAPNRVCAKMEVQLSYSIPDPSSVTFNGSVANMDTYEIKKPLMLLNLFLADQIIF